MTNNKQADVPLVLPGPAAEHRQGGGQDAERRRGNSHPPSRRRSSQRTANRPAASRAWKPRRASAVAASGRAGGSPGREPFERQADVAGESAGGRRHRPRTGPCARPVPGDGPEREPRTGRRTVRGAGRTRRRARVGGARRSAGSGRGTSCQLVSLPQAHKCRATLRTRRRLRPAARLGSRGIAGPRPARPASAGCSPADSPAPPPDGTAGPGPRGGRPSPCRTRAASPAGDSSQHAAKMLSFSLRLSCSTTIASNVLLPLGRPGFGSNGDL